MKYNMGCGDDIREGWVNIDKFAHDFTVKKWDLERTPWPINGNTADEMLWNHSLEHVGQSPGVFCRIMQEIYRVCCDGAKVHINVPHPLSFDFLGDPTHVRAVTPEMLALFSTANCFQWAKSHAANSRLAVYYNVDFELAEPPTYVLTEYWHNYVKEQKASQNEIEMLMRTHFNVVKEIRMVLTVIK